MGIAQAPVSLSLWTLNLAPLYTNPGLSHLHNISHCAGLWTDPSQPGLPALGPEQTAWEQCAVWTTGELGELLLSGWLFRDLLRQGVDWKGQGPHQCSPSLTLKILDSEPVLREDCLKAGSPQLLWKFRHYPFVKFQLQRAGALKLVPATEYLFPKLLSTNIEDCCRTHSEVPPYLY